MPKARSLSELLADTHSPLRSYISTISPRLESTRGGTLGARAGADMMGFAEIAGSQLSASRIENADPGTAGTAFDYLARMLLPGFDVDSSVAALGVEWLKAHAAEVREGPDWVGRAEKWFDEAREIVGANGDFDRAALLLAWCEQPYRAGWRALRGAIGQNEEQLLADIAGMRVASMKQIGEWERQINEGTRYVPNPSFAGISDVVSGDGDWIIGDTLVDCKTAVKPGVSKLRDYLYQLIGYVLMDGEDELKIRSVAVWLPRYGLLPTWKLTDLFSAEVEAALPKLRKGFRDALHAGSVSIYEPVTAKRSYEVLADNMLTPTEGLDILASREEVSVRRKIARNPNTDPTTLARLGSDGDWSVRVIVAESEKSPPWILSQLTRDRSAVVRAAAARNPSTPDLSLLSLDGDRSEKTEQILREVEFSIESLGADEPRVLEDPRQLTTSEKDVNLGTFRSAIHSSKWRREDEHLLQILLQIVLLPDANRGDFLRNLRPTFAMRWEEWLEELPRGRHIPRFAWGIPQPIQDPAEQQRIRGYLAILAGDTHPWVREQVASSIDVGPETLEQLASDPDSNVRYLAAQRLILSGGLSTLTHFALHIDSAVRALVARQSETPVEVLTALASDDDRNVRLAVAHNPSTPPDLLDLLSRTKREAHSFDNFRWAVAGNPNALPSTLIRLSKVPDDEVAEALGANPGTPIKVLELLASRRGNPAIRSAVGRNPSASEAILTSLAKDRHPDVRDAVATNPNTPSQIATRLLATLERREELALREDLEPMDIESAGPTLSDRLEAEDRLAVRIDRNARRQSGLNAATKEAMLKAVSDTRREVRQSVALNPEATPEVLAFLAGDPSVEVRRAAASNPRIPLLLVDYLADDADDDVRRGIAYNPATDEATLYRLARDEATLVRASVAMNRNTPRRLLEAFAGSDDLLIARMASIFLDDEPLH